MDFCWKPPKNLGFHDSPQRFPQKAGWLTLSVSVRSSEIHGSTASTSSVLNKINFKEDPFSNMFPRGNRSLEIPWGNTWRNFSKLNESRAFRRSRVLLRRSILNDGSFRSCGVPGCTGGSFQTKQNRDYCFCFQQLSRPGDKPCAPEPLC